MTAVSAAARVFVLTGALFTLVLARMDVPVYVLVAAVVVSLLALYLVDRRGLLFGSYLVAFVVFALLRTVADDTGVPIRASYAADADTWIFGGTSPTEWLQGHIAAHWVDVACGVVYVTYYFAAHVVALVLWRRDAAAFKRYAVSILLAVYTGLAVSFAVPTAPPWLGPERVSRLLADVLGWNPERPGGMGTNPYAAMPSLHIALTVLVVFGLWRYRRLRVPALLYATAMAFTLVYAGEHYVVDELAGVVTAVAAWAVAGQFAALRVPSPRDTSQGLSLGPVRP